MYPQRKLILLALFIFEASCSSSSFVEVDSWIDASSLLNKDQVSVSNSVQKSAGISFYQNFFSGLLGSSCSYYPNDSRYAQVLYQKCGPFIAIPKTMSRYFLEPDAPVLGLPILHYKERLLFKDSEVNCDLY